MWCQSEIPIGKVFLKVQIMLGKMADFGEERNLLHMKSKAVLI